MHSPEMAERISTVLGKPVSAGGLRMALQRSRDRFVEFLLGEVAGSLPSPGADQVEQELIDLNLLEYCRPAMKRLGSI
jgi:hypothetical protein